MKYRNCNVQRTGSLITLGELSPKKHYKFKLKSDRYMMNYILGKLNASKSGVCSDSWKSKRPNKFNLTKDYDENKD